MSRLPWALLVVASLLWSLDSAAIASGPAVYAAGEVPSGGASAEFTFSLDDATPAAFDFWQYPPSGPRNISLTGVQEARCLGAMFGGQTFSLRGTAMDSSSGESVSLLLFLVDGGSNGPDRFSLKVSRSSGEVFLFVPMRDILAGDIIVGCT